MKILTQSKENLAQLKEDGITRNRLFILALQHMFAMFGSTVLVPALTGLNPAVALFTSGLGTLIFHLITGGKVPAYLGSSFAFIAPIIAAQNQFGRDGAMLGIITVGLVYALMSVVIRLLGTEFFRKLLPPVVIGPVIITIGLGLAPTAKDMASEHLLVAFVTLAIAVGVSVFAKGIIKVIPILLGIIGGYTFAAFLGLVDFAPVMEASWFALPKFALPTVSGNLRAITLVAPIALVTMVEHLGDVVAISSTVKKDFIEEPGLHRTLLGDGIATLVAGLFGGPPNTTYGENVGVLALTKVYNPVIIQLTAVIVILSSFVQKVGILIQTIPTAVMGGIVFLLFGMIASIGLRTLVENNVDLSKNRNLVIVSVTLVVGISNLTLSFAGLEFGGMGLAAIVGIVMNLILPAVEKDDEVEDLDEDLNLEPELRYEAN
ncbi:uracil-xanthine permease family protein [Halanaerobium congolense]|jgi:uracil permease|uniref:uracil-xanthine permease family protein n=1 Tax=Halanaerobium congolense TaxID=54121 RepID=UPI00087EADD1|nr:solute carrier family 23 protein [Halanaerobium congolense]SDH84461.1 uracil permease [Halanaerobium congolense]SHN16096.1 uracil permease [Halanaerobium congolense]